MRSNRYLLDKIIHLLRRTTLVTGEWRRRSDIHTRLIWIFDDNRPRQAATEATFQNQLSGAIGRCGLELDLPRRRSTDGDRRVIFDVLTRDHQLEGSGIQTIQTTAA